MTKNETRPNQPPQSIAGRVIDGWSEAIDGAIEASFRLSTSVIPRTRVSLPVRLIFSQVVSDFVDLLGNVDRGSGRAAMRDARALTEHAINLRTVLGSADADARYMAHLDVGPVLVDEHKFGAQFLRGKEKREAMHWIKVRGRQSRSRLKEAIEQYGSRFQRDWAGISLYDRAKRQNQEVLYDFYRLASLTTHGSSASMAGRMEESVNGSYRHYVGADIRAAPTALFGGISAVQDVLEALHDSGFAGDFEGTMDAIQEVRGRWAMFYRFSRLYEKLAMRKSLSHKGFTATVLAVSRTGSRRWYLDDPMSDVWVEGNEPPLNEFERNMVERFIGDVMLKSETFLDPKVSWLAVRLPSIAPPVVAKESPTVPEDALDRLEDSAYFRWVEDFVASDPDLVRTWSND